MAREMAERWKGLAFAGILLVVIAGLWMGSSALNAPPATGAVRDVSLSVEGDGWTIAYRADVTANATAFSILLEAADRLGFHVGYVQYGAPLQSVLVDSINGTRSGERDRWWLYWVDGAYGDVGADHKALSDGSDVLWAFREYPPSEA